MVLCHRVSGCRCVEAQQFFEMLGTTHAATQHHVPEDWNPQQHCLKNLKSHRSCSVPCSYLVLLSLLLKVNLSFVIVCFVMMSVTKLHDVRGRWLNMEHCWADNCNALLMFAIALIKKVKKFMLVNFVQHKVVVVSNFCGSVMMCI